MNEQLLVDLMGEIDISLLEENFMQKDVSLHNRVRSKKAYIKNGEEAGLQILDARKEAIINQIEYNERLGMARLKRVSDVKAGIEEKVNDKVVCIKKKFESAAGIISGIVAMIVLVAGVIKLLIHRKSAKFVVS